MRNTKENFVTVVAIRLNKDGDKIERLDVTREDGEKRSYRPKSYTAHALLVRFFLDSPVWLFESAAGDRTFLASSADYGVHYLPDHIKGIGDALEWCEQRGLTHTRLYRRLLREYFGEKGDTVVMYVTSYSWRCPACDFRNEEEKIRLNVTCEQCEKTFDVDDDMEYV